MDAARIRKTAEEYKESILHDRRVLHRNPETGMNLPKTTAYIHKRLSEMGYSPMSVGGGVVTTVGNGSEKCVLLRADADALPIREKTNLSFASQNGLMHACGHDMHTAMLLGAAKLLKQYESDLNGTVKLVFQPDEEGFHGAESMIENGVLQNPTPFCALALHVHSGTPSGYILCGKEHFMAGCTSFRITVEGVGCHGAMPETGVDPLFAANQIYLALHEISAREIPPKVPFCLTIGKMGGGDAPNVIPNKAFIEGTVRCFDDELAEHTVERIKTISECTAQALRAEAKLEIPSSVPSLFNHPKTLSLASQCAHELFGSDKVFEVAEGGMGSEDFSVYTKKVPCEYLLIGAGTQTENERYGKPMHNECVVFNEDILPDGAALYAYFAMRALEEKEK